MRAKYIQIAKALYPTFQVYIASKDYSYTIDTLPNVHTHFICRHTFAGLTVFDSTRAVADLTSHGYGSVKEYNEEFTSYFNFYNMIILP